MKRFFSTMLLAAAFLTAGCTDAYYETLEGLEDRVAELQQLCDRINSELNALQGLVTAIEQQDMITGITEIRSGSTPGYRINFVQHEAVTILNGQDGKRPLVSSRPDPNDATKWYWTVQYGDGESDWLLAPDGSRMPSIGTIPYIFLRDGWFYYRVDGGEPIKLGKADGENGDQMFRSVDTQNDNYVIFTLSNGEQLRIPTYRSYLALKSEFEKVNENAEAQTSLVLAALDKFLYITSVSPILAGEDTVGLSVNLSDGRQFRIHDGLSSFSPSIFIKKDSDGKFYWAYTIESSSEQWVLSPEGNKISASSEPVTVPQLSVTQDKDGQYYWTVSTGGDTEFLRFLVNGNWTPKAVDSVARAFSAVRDYPDSLVVVLKDSTTRFVLPKQHTVSLSFADGRPVDGTLQMRNGQEIRLSYVTYGHASLTLLTQGGFTATDEGGKIRIKAPAAIPDSGGKVMAFFSFSPDHTPVTLIKTIQIKKED